MDSRHHNSTELGISNPVHHVCINASSRGIFCNSTAFKTVIMKNFKICTHTTVGNWRVPPTTTTLFHSID